jgi:uncharacterized protein with HEPN domain
LWVEDIIVAIQKILGYTENLSADAFFADRKTLEAVLWNFTVIGEAARHIPPEVEAQYPAVPWQAMRGMRNFIIHEYPRVDPETIWNTTKDDLVPLLPLLKEALAGGDA